MDLILLLVQAFTASVPCEVIFEIMAFVDFDVLKGE